jgi:hypothetical protein
MVDTTTQADVAEIRRALDLLTAPGGVVEIRALKIPGRGKPHMAAGYFTDLDKAAEAATTQDTRQAAGVYLVLNEVTPALFARSPNQITDHLDPTTSDGDIARRRWLPLDFDPTRPTGVSSSEDEHCAAEDAARTCAAWLSSQGWPAPILADSGNGAHLLYRIDLPNDDRSGNLVRDTIAAVAARFTGGGVDVDRKVFNAARIWKLYGTTARKGHDMPDRPHRLAALIEVPDSVEVLPVERLKALVAMVAKPEPSRNNGNGAAQFDHRLDVPKWLGSRGVSFQLKDRPDKHGRAVFLLEQCPFDGNHGSGGETAIFQSGDGALTTRAAEFSAGLFNLIRSIWRKETGKRLSRMPDDLGRIEQCDPTLSIRLAMQQVAPYIRDGQLLPAKFICPLVRSENPGREAAQKAWATRRRKAVQHG